MTEVASRATEFGRHEMAVERSVRGAGGDEFEIGGRKLVLLSDPDVFKPTLTTSLLTEHALGHGANRVSVLDLGCGLGPIAIALAKSGAKHIWAVDLMPQACELARANAALNGVAERVTVLQGNLFEPVKDMKFDLIVDDVSGVAAKVARLSRWFPDQVPLGGIDGSMLTVKMLRSVNDYLVPSGVLLFPVLSLSNTKTIVATAKEVFGSAVECVATKHVPFSPELKANLPTLQNLKSLGLIHFDQVRSRCFWTLEIYKATRTS